MDFKRCYTGTDSGFSPVGGGRDRKLYTANLVGGGTVILRSHVREIFMRKDVKSDLTGGLLFLVSGKYLFAAEDGILRLRLGTCTTGCRLCYCLWALLTTYVVIGMVENDDRGGDGREKTPGIRFFLFPRFSRVGTYLPTLSVNSLFSSPDFLVLASSRPEP